MPRSILWLVFAQATSLIGSALVRFGINIWVYETTGSVAAFSVLALSSSLPGLLLMPIAGTVADRISRRKVLIVSDVIGAISLVLVLVSALAGRLELWQIAVVTALASGAEAFQWPSLAATIPQLVSKDKLGRANGFLEAAQAIATVGAPVLGGALYPLIQLSGLVMIEIVTCLFGVGVVALLPLPRTAADERGQANKGVVDIFKNFLVDGTFGFRWIWQRKPLVLLLLFFTTLNFMHSMYYVVWTPYLLSFGSEATLGGIRSAAGVGLVTGGLVLATWGGPRRKSLGVIFGWLVSSVIVSSLGLLREPLILGALAFIGGLMSPLINGSSSAIWQSVCPNEVQGRVFAARRMIAWGANPIAQALAAPVAQQILQPALSLSLLAGTFGSGQTGGLSLMIFTLGAISAIIALLGLAAPGLRHIERELQNSRV